MNKFCFSVVLLLYFQFLIELQTVADELIIKPKVIILTGLTPPKVYINDQGEIIGPTVVKIQAIFKQAGVSYEMKIRSWQRAFADVKQRKDTMIFPLARISDREQQFKWIIPLYTLNLKLFGLKGKFDENESNISSRDFKFICPVKTILCIALKEHGIPESSILTMSHINDQQIIQMVLQGRINFILISELALEYNLEKMGLDRSLFAKLKNYNYQVVEYLAGNEKLDSTKIQNAAKHIPD